MFTRAAIATVLTSGLMVLCGCGGGGADYYSQQKGVGGGAATLDIAGSYQVAPDTFGFNMLTIYQSGNSLTAVDNGGGSWSGTLTNMTVEERSGAGGGTVVTWRGDVNLSGKNAVGDDLSLVGAVEIVLSAAGNVVQITAEYQNTSIGLSGSLLLTQVSAVPGGTPGAGGGAGGGGGGSGAENK